MKIHFLSFLVVTLLVAPAFSVNELPLNDGVDSCILPPPALGDGSETCQPDCVMYQILKAGVLTAISEIPFVGDFFENLADAFWPEKSAESQAEILESTITYVMANVNREVNQEVLDLVSSDFEGFVSTALELDNEIKNGGTANSRTSFLVALISDCDNMYPTLHTFVHDANGPAPTSIVPLIGSIGSACIAMNVARAFHYESTTGDAVNEDLIESYQADLDQHIDEYTALMKDALDKAQTDRKAHIETIVDGKNYGRCDCSNWNPFCHKNVAILRDDACPSVGGSQSTGDRNEVGKDKVVNMGYQCGKDFSQDNKDELNSLMTLYENYSVNSYTDNFLSAARELPPLWQLQTSANIKARNTGTLQVRLASGLFTNDDHGLAWSDEDPLLVAPSLTEVTSMYSHFNDGNVGGGVNDRITQFVVAHDNNGVTGYEITYSMDGAEQMYKFGSYDDKTATKQTRTLNPNERITGVGLQYCKSTYDYFMDCHSQGMALQISTVDSEGALDTSVELDTWNDLGYPNGAAKTAWLVAPPLTNSTSFAPHLMAVVGFGRHLGLVRFPLWAYGAME